MLGGFVEVSDKSIETRLDAADTECPRHGSISGGFYVDVHCALGKFGLVRGLLHRGTVHCDPAQH
jgi:hypothetical protein